MNSEKCRQAALRYVAVRMRTEGQVQDYLRRKGFEEDHISEAVDMLREYRYVDDTSYCMSYYKQACLKGRGRKRIEKELENKMIPRQVVSEAISTLLSEESPLYEEIMEEILSEKVRAVKVARMMAHDYISSGGGADRKLMAKMGRRLSALGYGSQTIYSVIGQVMNETVKQMDEETQQEQEYI